MKKAITLSLFLFANMVLLAHTVLPHHHHEEVAVCFVNAHCEGDEEEAHAHQQAASGHHHDSSNSLDDCSIKYTYRQSANEKQIRDLGDFSYLQFPLFLLSSHTNLIPKIETSCNLSFELPPFVVSFYSVYITRSLGLRAPPVC